MPDEKHAGTSGLGDAIAEVSLAWLASRSTRTSAAIGLTILGDAAAMREMLMKYQGATLAN